MRPEIRYRILSVVSSDRQAAEDLVSRPLQTARSRAEGMRRGWVEVAPPVEIAESRRRFTLAELRAASAEIDDLCRQMERGDLDVLATRDQSRLGRYQSLQVELLSFMEACNVQPFFYVAPAEVIAPDEFRRRGFDVGRRYQFAFEAVRSQDDVDRLVSYHRDAMDAYATRGEYRRSSAATPYGYRREVVTLEDGRQFHGRLVPFQPEAGHVLMAYQAYLDGETSNSLRKLLRAWTGLRFQKHDHVLRLLKNPTYVGVMFRGQRRSEVVVEAGQRKRTRRVVVPDNRMAAICAAWLRGEDTRTEEERAEGIIVAWGAWEPIVPAELWLAVQDERRRRRDRPRTAGTTGNVYPLAGLGICAHCGGPVGVVSWQYKHPESHMRRARQDYRRKPRYGCLTHRREKGCQPKSILLERLEAALFERLRQYASDPDLLASLADEAERERQEALGQRRADAAQRIAALERQKARWDAAYAESETLSLVEWEERTGPLREQLAGLRGELAALDAERASYMREEERLARLRGLVDDLDAQMHDKRRVLKGRLRQVVHHYELADGALRRVVLL